MFTNFDWRFDPIEEERRQIEIGARGIFSLSLNNPK